MTWAISYILGMTGKINERGTTWEKGNVGTRQFSLMERNS